MAEPIDRILDRYKGRCIAIDVTRTDAEGRPELGIYLFSAFGGDAKRKVRDWLKELSPQKKNKMAIRVYDGWKEISPEEAEVPLQLGDSATQSPGKPSGYEIVLAVKAGAIMTLERKPDDSKRPPGP